MDPRFRGNDGFLVVFIMADAMTPRDC